MSDLHEQEIIGTLPKISYGELDPFLRCLGRNIRRTAFYKYFIWGNLGKLAYLNKYCPKVLTMIIKNFRENTLFITTGDSNNCDLKHLIKNWNDISIKTLEDKMKFQTPPLFKPTSKSSHRITIRENNYISLHYCIIPLSLEFQVANINKINHNLDIPKEIQNNHHQFLKEVARKLDLSTEDLIKSSVDLLLNEKWLREIKHLIEKF